MNALKLSFLRGLFLCSAVAGNLCAATVLAQSYPSSHSQSYPTKPVRVIVAFTVGGTTDILTRAVSQKLTERLKQSFVVENKPGGGGNIGTEYVAKAPADGYTLIMNSVGPIAVNLSLYKKLNINPLVDLVPIVQVADVPNVLVVNQNLPIKSIEELIAYGKSNPGQLNYASTGVGTSSHLSGFMLARRAGIEATHIPYKGADALTDLISGRVQMMFATIPSVIQHIHAGKLRAIAVTSLKRSRSMPTVPTVAERGFPGFEAGSWFGLFAPKDTPPEVILFINQQVNELLPSLEAQLIREGADPAGGSALKFSQFVHKEYEKWKIIVRESGAAAD